VCDPGLSDYLTVYSREPNFHSDGSILTNVNTATQTTLETLFQNANINNATAMARAVNTYLNPPRGAKQTFPNLLAFFLFCNQSANGAMTSAEFANIYNDITTTTGTNNYIYGRLNINTARADVLTALFMGSGISEQTAESAAQNMISYRDQNPQGLNSVAWMVDALGTQNQVVTTMAAANATDKLTVHSYQFTADIAAVGPYGRGYRRVKFVFDVSEGSPKILYRQDLSRLGWALGTKARENLMANATK